MSGTNCANHETGNIHIVPDALSCLPSTINQTGLDPLGGLPFRRASALDTGRWLDMVNCSGLSRCNIFQWTPTT